MTDSDDSPEAGERRPAELLAAGYLDELEDLEQDDGQPGDADDVGLDPGPEEVHT